MTGSTRNAGRRGGDGKATEMRLRDEAHVGLVDNGAARMLDAAEMKRTGGGEGHGGRTNHEV